MMNAKGFFFFKFSSWKGVEDVLKNGPWVIRTVPIILNTWSPSINLTKEDLLKVPVWVKHHDFPMAAFTVNGLSMIATKLGNTMMLDSYKSTMCSDSWGRNSYDRALIESNLEHELKEKLVVAIPLLDGMGYTRATIGVKYEWKPPRYDTCKTFGHMIKHCSKLMNASSNVHIDGQDDGSVVVNRKGNKGNNLGKLNQRKIDGIRLNKPNS